MLPVEEPQGNLNAPEKGEQITEQPNQVEFDTPHIEEQTANHEPTEGDHTPTTTRGGGNLLDTHHLPLRKGGKRLQNVVVKKHPLSGQSPTTNTRKTRNT